MQRAGAILLVLLSACVDKAKADYDRCVDLDKNYDAKGAMAACSAAVAADPKSPSGQAAAKKLFDLRSVNDKLSAESADKAARDAKIAKDDPNVTVQPTATASVATAVAMEPEVAADAGADDVTSVARGLYAAGDYAGARKVLDPRVFGHGAKPTSDELSVLSEVCLAQQDKKCGKDIVAIMRRRH